MAGVMSADFDSPDETRTPDKTTVDIVHLGDMSIARFRMEPGWRWSECIKPIVGTEQCELRHVGVVLEGTMHIVHGDGQETDLIPGSGYIIEPGHEAWVTSDGPFVAYEFESKSAETYATPGD